jgi:F-type H+/Na+-transporting ATPase subunit alpha
MSFRPDEVTAVIKEELRKYTTTLEMESRGSILQVGEGIARV